MTTYSFEIENEIWQTFKTICTIKGLKVKEAIKEAIINWIEQNKTENINLKVEIIQNNQKNILNFVIEEQVREYLKAIIEAKKRNASPHHITELKFKIIDILRRNPTVSEQLANEIKTVFENIAKR